MDRLLRGRLEALRHHYISSTLPRRSNTFRRAGVGKVCKIFSLTSKILKLIELFLLDGSYLKVASQKPSKFSRSSRRSTEKKSHRKSTKTSPTVAQECKKKKPPSRVTRCLTCSKHLVWEKSRFFWFSFGWRFRWFSTVTFEMSAVSDSTSFSHSQWRLRRNFRQILCSLWHLTDGDGDGSHSERCWWAESLVCWRFAYLSEFIRRLSPFSVALVSTSRTTSDFNTLPSCFRPSWELKVSPSFTSWATSPASSHRSWFICRISQLSCRWLCWAFWELSAASYRFTFRKHSTMSFRRL